MFCIRDTHHMICRQDFHHRWCILGSHHRCYKWDCLYIDGMCPRPDISDRLQSHDRTYIVFCHCHHIWNTFFLLLCFCHSRHICSTLLFPSHNTYHNSLSLCMSYIFLSLCNLSKHCQCHCKWSIRL